MPRNVLRGADLPGRVEPAHAAARGRVVDGVLFQVGADPRLVSRALAQVEAGAREAGRTLDDLTLSARAWAARSTKTAPGRGRRMKPYAAVAAKTSFDAIPAEVLPLDLLEDAHELRAATTTTSTPRRGAPPPLRHRAMFISKYDRQTMSPKAAFR